MAESTIPEVLAAYEGRGFTGQFASRPGAMVHCHACGADEPAAQTPVLAMHRLEGSTDPSDEALVTAIECLACGAKGTLVLSYGPEASPEDGAVMVDLLDDRDQASIPMGI